MKNFKKSPFILILALGLALYSLWMVWFSVDRSTGAIVEAIFVTTISGREVLHNDHTVAAMLFYLGAMVLAIITHFFIHQERTKIKLYKLILYLNVLPIGAFLWAMLLNYYIEGYDKQYLGKGYFLWIGANAVVIFWLVLRCYTNLLLPLTLKDPTILDDL